MNKKWIKRRRIKKKLFSLLRRMEKTVIKNIDSVIEDFDAELWITEERIPMLDIATTRYVTGYDVFYILGFKKITSFCYRIIKGVRKEGINVFFKRN